MFKKIIAKITGGRRLMLSLPPVAIREKLLRQKNASLPEKVRYDVFSKPSYAYGVFFAALQAKQLGFDRVSVYEFGVAKGAGLVQLEKIAVEVEEYTGVSIEVYGFDTGSGMPKSVGYQDLPNVWKPGFFHMDVDALKNKLSRAELVLGDVSETVPGFLETANPAPIGFVSVDVDYYSGTVEILKLFNSEEKYFLPRVYCYFDDIIGDDWEIHCEYVGELLAIKEFNEQHEERKISKIHGFMIKRPLFRPWNEKMFVMHAFDHSLYCKYINPKPHWEKTRM